MCYFLLRNVSTWTHWYGGYLSLCGQYGYYTALNCYIALDLTLVCVWSRSLRRWMRRRRNHRIKTPAVKWPGCACGRAKMVKPLRSHRSTIYAKRARKWIEIVHFYTFPVWIGMALSMALSGSFWFPWENVDGECKQTQCREGGFSFQSPGGRTCQSGSTPQISRSRAFWCRHLSSWTHFSSTSVSVGSIITLERSTQRVHWPQ